MGPGCAPRGGIKIECKDTCLWPHKGTANSIVSFGAPDVDNFSEALVTKRVDELMYLVFVCAEQLRRGMLRKYGGIQPHTTKGARLNTAAKSRTEFICERPAPVRSALSFYQSTRSNRLNIRERLRKGR